MFFVVRYDVILMSRLRFHLFLTSCLYCSDEVFYTYQRTYTDLSKQFNRVYENRNLRVLVYNGDTDMAVNFLGDQWFVEDLKRPVKKTSGPWYVNGQVAGFATIYDRITFTTIRVSNFFLRNVQKRSAARYKFFRVY